MGNRYKTYIRNKFINGDIMSWLISIGVVILAFFVLMIIVTLFFLILQHIEDTFDIPMIISFLLCVFICVFVLCVWATHMKYFGV